MAKKIFITATNTNIGKTYTAKKVLSEFASRGFSIGVLKPVETGVDELPSDALELFSLAKTLNPKLNTLDLSDIVPFTFTEPMAPFVASRGEDLDLGIIKSAITKQEDLCDILIIEGAGGVLVPINFDYTMLDLAREFCDATLLVSHCNLGCINDAMLSKNALQDLPHQLVFNPKNSSKESFLATSKPYFDAKGIETLFVDDDIAKICDILYNSK
ncbi:MAG: dethiobiotin synthase [Sulfuricurvum sp.]|jgi:dethiobiotin synthetase